MSLKKWWKWRGSFLGTFGSFCWWLWWFSCSFSRWFRRFSTTFGRTFIYIFLSFGWRYRWFFSFGWWFWFVLSFTFSFWFRSGSIFTSCTFCGAGSFCFLVSGFGSSFGILGFLLFSILFLILGFTLFCLCSGILFIFRHFFLWIKAFLENCVIRSSNCLQTSSFSNGNLTSKVCV